MTILKDLDNSCNCQNQVTWLGDTWITAVTSDHHIVKGIQERWNQSTEQNHDNENTRKLRNAHSL